MPDARRQLDGAEAIEAALDAGESPRLLLVREGSLSETARRVLERCRAAGVAVRKSGQRDMQRMSRSGGAELLALAGLDPELPDDALYRAGGALWLLAGVAYPGNAGFAIRTAEVSGAVGVLVDAPFDHAGRRQALRASMRADRFLPVRWVRAGEAVEAARSAGRRVLAVEDTGRSAPWEVDLTGACLLVIGGESEGVPGPVLTACDDTIRIPMRGFIPAYNLQAAMAVVTGERLRQQADESGS